ncbi:MAG: sensor histidine kinase [Deinococcus sp.]
MLLPPHQGALKERSAAMSRQAAASHPPEDEGASATDLFVLPRTWPAADALSPLMGHLMVLLVYLGEALLIGALWYAQPHMLTPLTARLGVSAFALFGLSYLVQARSDAFPRRRLVMVVIMSLSSVIFNFTFSRLESYTALPLQVVSAIVIVGVVPGRTAALWIVGQSLTLAWASAWNVPLAFGLLLYPGYTVMQLFSAYLMKVMIRERAQRLEVVRLSEELRRARDAVALASRAAKRHRIARDLHDTLGHRLTALSLELEYAAQLSQSEVRQAVERAYDINRQLLSEVRQTVGAIREQSELSLERQLELLGHPFASLDLQVQCPDELTLSGELSDTLLKCAREAVTNAVRHAAASHIRLHLSREQDAACLHIENALPASGARAWHEGHGLRGMRERLEAVGGQLSVSRKATSFQVSARVPLSGGAGEAR